MVTLISVKHMNIRPGTNSGEQDDKNSKPFLLILLANREPGLKSFVFVLFLDIP